MTSRFAFHGYLLRLVVEMTILFVFVLLADVLSWSGLACRLVKVLRILVL